MSEVSERLDLHDKVFALLLEKVRQDRYPSSHHLDLLEQNLVGHEREAFVDVLYEKVVADRYPSTAMLSRLIRLAG